MGIGNNTLWLNPKKCAFFAHDFCFLPLGTGQLVMYGNERTTEDDASDNPQNNHDDQSTASNNGVQTSKAGSDMILYIVFGVAVAVFILVLIIIVKILRRKNPNPNGYTLTSTGKILALILVDLFFFDAARISKSFA